VKPAGRVEQPTDGSRLCLACGLCCQGLLHDQARLRKGEAAAARRLGLDVGARQGEAMFSLPCACHRDGRCTVYQDRLSPCREYRCKLLRACEAGQVTWEDGLRRVEQAKRLVASIRGRLGVPEAGAGLWRQLREAGSGLDAADAEARLDVATLLTLCQQHFWDRSGPRETFGP
jgi:hypothetical protein